MDEGQLTQAVRHAIHDIKPPFDKGNPQWRRYLDALIDSVTKRLMPEFSKSNQEAVEQYIREQHTTQGT